MSLCADAKVCEIVLLSRATLEKFLVIYLLYNWGTENMFYI